MTWFSSLFKKSPVYQSKIHGSIMIKNRYGSPAVLTGNITQSGGEFVFMWKKLFELLKKENSQIKTCLVLGVGGGTSLQSLPKYFSDVKITGIELDPVMIEIAENYFQVNNVLVKLVEDDACEWVKKHVGKQKYDLIIVDLYIGVLNVPESRKKPFLIGIKQLVKPSGKILYNVHYRKQNVGEYENFFALCHTIFSRVDKIFEFPLNRIVLLSSEKTFS